MSLKQGLYTPTHEMCDTDNTKYILFLTQYLSINNETGFSVWLLLLLFSLNMSDVGLWEKEIGKVKQVNALTVHSYLTVENCITWQ